MSSAARTSLLAGIALLSVGFAGCASLTEGYANNRAGFQARNEMCKSVRTFVRAPLGNDGARRAWFLPFGVYSDGSVSFYAPMASDPRDDFSIAFYENNVGQLTHYHVMPDFAPIVASCLRSGHGFSRRQHEKTDDGFRGSYRDVRMNRRIEVAASRARAGFLVAAADWGGDIEGELSRMLRLDCDPEPDSD